jgi:6-aminohexanoate-oligomer endohydrolase
MFRSDRILTSGDLVSQGSPGAKPWSCGSSNSRSLTFDLPEVRIGIAECNEGPTGITVFLFPERVSGVVDTRGGAPGSSLTEALNASFGKYINAIAFCGGSAYGLEAASGVAAGLLHSGFASQRWGGVAIVPAAVVFDFKGRQNAVYPDKELGLKALEAARDSWFPLGAHGVGSFVHCGSYFGESFMERSGQGAAFQKLESTRLAVFTVVNARGAMVDRAGSCSRQSRSSHRFEKFDTSRSERGQASRESQSAGLLFDGQHDLNSGHYQSRPGPGSTSATCY